MSLITMKKIENMELILFLNIFNWHYVNITDREFDQLVVVS